MNQNTPWVLGIGEVLWDMLPDGKHCGGAVANVVYHLSKGGIKSAITSAVGNDALGEELLDFLSSRGISTEFVSTNNFNTGIVEVSLNNGIPQYNICQPSAWDRILLSGNLKKILPELRAVIFGTLAQRSPESRNTICEVLQSVPETCLKIFDINLRQHYYDKELIHTSLKLCNVLKINDEELNIIAKLFPLGNTPQQMMKSLAEQYRLKAVILTLGKDGSMLFDGNSFSEYPVIPCKVADTVGCGDAFLAGWCSAVLKGESMKKAMQTGTELSAVVASQKGAME